MFRNFLIPSLCMGIDHALRPIFMGCPFPRFFPPCLFPWYYGGSVAMRLVSFRRSRFCAYETCSVFRCPFVPYLVHHQLFIEEGFWSSISLMTYCFLQTDYLCSFSISPSQAWFDGCCLASYRNLGLAIGQLHHYPPCGLLAHRTCGPMRYMPSLMFRVTSMLLSTFDFRRRVSSCPRGFLPPSSPVLHGDFIYTDTAHSQRQ